MPPRTSSATTAGSTVVNKPVVLEWRDTEIELTKESLPWLAAQETRRIKATVLGCFAVHATQRQRFPLPKGEVKFTLTHLPSGSRVVQSDRELDLRRIAMILAKNYQAAFSYTDKAKIRQSLPAHALSWLQECWKQKGWVSPQGENEE